jgi:hypothetical protein
LMWESEKIDNDPYGNMIQAKDLWGIEYA